jgi:hypothetical protein
LGDEAVSWVDDNSAGFIFFIRTIQRPLAIKWRGLGNGDVSKNAGASVLQRNNYDGGQK